MTENNSSSFESHFPSQEDVDYVEKLWGLIEQARAALDQAETTWIGRHDRRINELLSPKIFEEDHPFYDPMLFVALKVRENNWPRLRRLERRFLLSHIEREWPELHGVSDSRLTQRLGSRPPLINHLERRVDATDEFRHREPTIPKTSEVTVQGA